MPTVDWTDHDLIRTFRKYDTVRSEITDTGVRVVWNANPQLGSAPQKDANRMGYYAATIQPLGDGRIAVEYREQ